MSTEIHNGSKCQEYLLSAQPMALYPRLHGGGDFEEEGSERLEEPEGGRSA